MAAHYYGNATQIEAPAVGQLSWPEVESPSRRDMRVDGVEISPNSEFGYRPSGAISTRRAHSFSERNYDHRF
jgi:hypothetical protein